MKRGNNGGSGPQHLAGPTDPRGKKTRWPFIGEEWSRYRRP